MTLATPERRRRQLSSRTRIVIESPQREDGTGLVGESDTGLVGPLPTSPANSNTPSGVTTEVHFGKSQTSSIASFGSALDRIAGLASTMLYSPSKEAAASTTVETVNEDMKPGGPVQANQIKNDKVESMRVHASEQRMEVQTIQPLRQMMQSPCVSEGMPMNAPTQEQTTYMDSRRYNKGYCSPMPATNPQVPCVSPHGVDDLDTRSAYQLPGSPACSPASTPGAIQARRTPPRAAATYNRPKSSMSYFQQQPRQSLSRRNLRQLSATADYQLSPMARMRTPEVQEALTVKAPPSTPPSPSSVAAAEKFVADKHRKWRSRAKLAAQEELNALRRDQEEEDDDTETIDSGFTTIHSRKSACVGTFQKGCLGPTARGAEILRMLAQKNQCGNLRDIIAEEFEAESASSSEEEESSSRYSRRRGRSRRRREDVPENQSSSSSDEPRRRKRSPTPIRTKPSRIRDEVEQEESPPPPSPRPIKRDVLRPTPQKAERNPAVFVPIITPPAPSPSPPLPSSSLPRQRLATPSSEPESEPESQPQTISDLVHVQEQQLSDIADDQDSLLFDEEEEKVITDKNFGEKFVKNMITEGMSLLWHQNKPKGVSAYARPIRIHAYIRRGTPSGPAQFVWMKNVASANRMEEYGSIELLDLVSVSKASATETRGYPFAMPGTSLFLKTAQGQQFLFEADEGIEAWCLLRGLQWTVARWVFHLMVGLPDMNSELTDEGLEDVTHQLVDKCMMRCEQR